MKDAYNILYEALERDKFNPFNPITQVNNVMMYYAPKTLLEIGEPCSISIQLETHIGIIDAILVDDTYYGLSRESREFVMFHEMWNIEYGNLYSVDKGSYTSRFISCIADDLKVSKSVLDADMYAANIIGYDKAIRALIELRDSPWMWRKHISKRIAMLKKQQKRAPK